MADLYSKVTLRPRSKLERILELMQPTVPRRPDSGILIQLALFYLIAAEVTTSEASRIVKHLANGKGSLDGERLTELDAAAIPDTCPARNVPDLLAELRALGRAALDGLEETARRDPEEARRRLRALPRLNVEHVDLILLTTGCLSTVAPSTTARRVAARLGFPGSNYAALSRALDAEIPEGDATEVAWRAHHALAQHGRDICHVAKPQCGRCVVKGSCSYQGQGVDPASRLSNPGL